MAFNSDEAKNLLLSKTFWGVVVMVVAVFSHNFSDKLAGGVDEIIAAVGAVLALYGRYKASGPVGLFGSFFSKSETK